MHGEVSRTTSQPRRDIFAASRGEPVSTRRAVLIALALGLAAGMWSYALDVHRPEWNVDLHPIIISMKALAGGGDPYTAIGPRAPYRWPWPQFYPATAFAVLLPLAPLSLEVATALFIGLSVFWLVFVVLRVCPHRVPMLFSGAFIWAVQFRQWTPALVAAAFTPALAGVLAAKPTTGLALLAGARRPVIVGAVVGSALLLCVAFALDPGWLRSWYAIISQPAHFVAPVTCLPFGPLVLLGLLRWRRPEARLLVALACIPQTNAVQDTLPLFLVTATYREALVLAATTQAASALFLAPLAFRPTSPSWGWWLVLFAYLPCLVMVLRRRTSRPRQNRPRDRLSRSRRSREDGERRDALRSADPATQ